MRSNPAPSIQDAHPTSVFFAIIVSSAIHPLSSQELYDLLQVGRDCYHALNITGILLYKDGNFMQLLEGSEADVRSLLELIALDSRHFLITTLIEGFAPERQYPDWTMAFPTDDADDLRAIPGYSAFLNTPLIPVVNPTNTQKLLLAFKMYVGDILIDQSSDSKFG